MVSKKGKTGKKKFEKRKNNRKVKKQASIENKI